MSWYRESLYGDVETQWCKYCDKQCSRNNNWIDGHTSSCPVPKLEKSETERFAKLVESIKNHTYKG